MTRSIAARIVTALALVAAAPLLGQSCPTGNIQNFENAGVSCGASTCSLSYVWSPLQGASSYEIGLAEIPNFCTNASNFTFLGPYLPQSMLWLTSRSTMTISQ